MVSDIRNYLIEITTMHGIDSVFSWEHKRLADIAKALGAKKVTAYPGDSFDLIWTLNAPYKKISSITSENCPGLDDQDH